MWLLHKRGSGISMHMLLLGAGIVVPTVALKCPRTYLDAVDGARAGIRTARNSGHRRIKLTLPVLPPGRTVDESLLPDGAALWPGGGAQSHRQGLQPLIQPLLSGYEPTFHGMIDVGMGVWSFAGGGVTAVSNVADLSFDTFAKLCDGGFGEAPTRPDHTLLLINPRLSSSAAIGQPWQRDLRRRASELIDDASWVWAYRCRPIAAPDGVSCLGVAVSSELSRAADAATVSSRLCTLGGDCIASSAGEPFTTNKGLLLGRQLLADVASATPAAPPPPSSASPPPPLPSRRARPLSMAIPASPPPASPTGSGGCKYGTKEYWDGMYAGVGEAAADGLPADEYSWYCGWDVLEPFWRELVPEVDCRVLIPGVGNDGTGARHMRALAIKCLGAPPRLLFSPRHSLTCSHSLSHSLPHSLPRFSLSGCIV